MQRTKPLVQGEVYHIYNRGAHKATIFKNSGAYERFQALLLISNQKEAIHMGNLLTKYKGPSFIKIFEEQVPKETEKLVDVLGYCLMPNHFHLVLRQRAFDGISTFMRKVATSYSMYFNARHEHSGTLFQGRFKSSHVDSSRYLLWLLRYVHLNALDLALPEWRRGDIDRKKATNHLNNYRWSSRSDYRSETRPEKSILTLSDEYDPDDVFTEIEAVRENIKDGPLYL